MCDEVIAEVFLAEKLDVSGNILQENGPIHDKKQLTEADYTMY